MMQQNLVPDKAAAIVVHPIPGVGDTTDIQEAVNMLPADGGRIFIREGTYALPDTVTLPDKSVDIVGSGGTVIDLGNLANTPAFTIPDGLTDKRIYTFTNFTVTSNSRVGSSVVSIQDTHAFGIVTIRNVNAIALNQYIEITAGDVAFLTPVVVAVYDCHYEQTTTLFNRFGAPIRSGAVCDLVNDNGISNLMEVSFTNMKYMFDEFAAIGGSISGDSFGNLDVSFYDCDLALASEEGFSTIHAERCRIWNFTGTPQIWFVNGNPASSDYVPESAFINCNVLGIWIIDTGGMNVTGGWWTNTRIESNLINGRSSVFGVSFRADGTSVAVFPVSAGITAFFGNCGDISIEGCTFSNSAITITAYIYAGSDLVIKGCAFRGLGGASTAGIRLNGVNNFVTQCDFDTNNWGCPPVLEVAPADRNIYNDCFGLNGNGGVDSTFVGVRNTFNGLSQLRFSAATTGAFVTITTFKSASGLTGIGTIKNIGANSMTIRVTTIDQFGTTATVTPPPITAGNDFQISTTALNGTGHPPYNSYMIEVESTAVPSPTTYDLRVALNCEVSW